MNICISGSVSVHSHLTRHTSDEVSRAVCIKYTVRIAMHLKFDVAACERLLLSVQGRIREAGEAHVKMIMVNETLAESTRVVLQSVSF